MMESNLLLEQYGKFKKAELEEAVAEEMVLHRVQMSVSV